LKPFSHHFRLTLAPARVSDEAVGGIDSGPRLGLRLATHVPIGRQSNSRF